MLGTHQSPGAITQARPHPLADELVLQHLGCCCQPTLGKLGSGVRHISNPASKTACWHCLTEWKQATGSSATMRSAIAGCRCLTMRGESAQLAQCAAGRTRTALGSPSPPAENAKVVKTRTAAGALRVPKIWQKHVHTLSSWRLANVSVSAGLRARSQ